MDTKGLKETDFRKYSNSKLVTETIKMCIEFNEGMDERDRKSTTKERKEELQDRLTDLMVLIRQHKLECVKRKLITNLNDTLVKGVPTRNTRVHRKKLGVSKDEFRKKIEEKQSLHK